MFKYLNCTYSIKQFGDLDENTQYILYVEQNDEFKCMSTTDNEVGTVTILKERFSNEWHRRQQRDIALYTALHKP